MSSPESTFSWSDFAKDLPASLSVALVALPLCLGIALASQATGENVDKLPLMSGLIAGIIGGIVVGALSGSHTSVSGPAAGLVATVVVAMQDLQSFQLFLYAVILAGVIQILMGVFRAGVIAYYFPTAVIRGLLAAIGLILIFKQIPHALGLDKDPEGDFSFFQLDGFNTFSELSRLDDFFQPAAAIIFLTCLIVYLGWSRIPKLGKSVIPAALMAVLTGLLLNQIFIWSTTGFALNAEHLVSLAEGGKTFRLIDAFTFPSLQTLTQIDREQAFHLLKVGIEIAVIASLETLLNLEACDRLDPQRRVSPPNRELIAQGIGNVSCGVLGGLPLTSVVVRSSANIYSGGRSKMSTILHGIWLAIAVLAIPNVLQMIPLSALAAILIATGFKLASPTVFREIFKQGPRQYLPFLATVLGTFFTDLLYGVLIGLAFGLFFLLRSMAIRPFAQTEKRPTPGNIQRIVLAQHMSFLSRASVVTQLDELDPGTHIILDASKTDYIDPDILNLFRDFIEHKAPLRNIQISQVGFQDSYQFPNKLAYSDVVTSEWQASMSPQDALNLLIEGNQRFTSGTTLERDLEHQRHQTASGQHPMAAVLGCIDSRVPAEIVFDAGIGSIFAVRIAGNVVSDDVLASLEYAGAASKVNCILVLGHTDCGAVRAACSDFKMGHITSLLDKIRPSVQKIRERDPNLAIDSPQFANQVAEANVHRTMEGIRENSPILKALEDDGQLLIAGAVYHLDSGKVHFLNTA